MKLNRIKISAIWLTMVGLASLIGSSLEIAVMSIDIGSESMKVAIVSPGVPMEIALNKESKRKTPVTIAFRNGERSFGEDAQVIGIRFPQNSFSYILDLLGKSIENPMVQLFMKRFPHYNIIADNERQTIAFKLDENTTYTPEELVAQILHKGKEFAESSAGQKINEAVITVPGFFNQAERRALMQAAELADLKVLQLINDYTAVALNYGIFRSKEINETAHCVMFYDMGASSTTATLVSYQNVKTKERGFVETNPHVTILGVGYDRTLGGLEVQIRLQRYLATEFDNLNKTRNSVFSSPRAMAKLFKEAGRVKNVLSANPDHFAQVEGLMEEHDFRLRVTREKLEELCSDLFERVADPVKMALKSSGLSMDVISQVVLVGAGTRMPKIQEYLTRYVTIELSKNINTDEAAALGAVYKAADLSQGFKVKKFVTKDAVLFPIQIVFDRAVEDKVKQVKKMLFNRLNPYPQKKIITFNKHSEDFEFSINYAELDHLPAEERANVGQLNLSRIRLSGIEGALAKHGEEGTESKGIKAHFAMDESGLLNLANVELVFEKSSTVPEEEEGTFSILGSTISKLFAGSDEKEEADKSEDVSQQEEDVKPVHEEAEYSGGQQEHGGDDDKSKNKKKKKKKENETTLNEDQSVNKTEEKAEKEKKPSILTIKEPINAVETKLGAQMLSGQKLADSREKLQKLDAYDSEKARRETALNNLETFVIDAQQKLESEEYLSAARPEEASKISKACAEVSEWLYEDGFSASAEVFEDKLRELEQLTKDVYERVFERKEYPEALNAMVLMVNKSKQYLENMQNLSLSSEKIFTPVEIETLEKTINETEEYHNIAAKSFASSEPYEAAKYKLADIANKMAILDREVKYLVNKAKIRRPKQEESASPSQPETTSEKKWPAGEKEESENDSDSKATADRSGEPDKPAEENGESGGGGGGGGATTTRTTTTTRRAAVDRSESSEEPEMLDSDGRTGTTTTTTTTTTRTRTSTRTRTTGRRSSSSRMDEPAAAEAVPGERPRELENEERKLGIEGNGEKVEGGEEEGGVEEGGEEEGGVGGGEVQQHEEL